MSTTGTIAMMRPVAIMPTSSSLSPRKRWMPSGSVRFASSVISTTAYRNSFQSRIVLRITVEEIARDAGEEALEDVHGERQLHRDVHRDQAGEGVVEAVLNEDLEEGDDRDLRREDDRREDHEVEDAIGAEAVAREAVGGHRAGHGEDRDRGEHDDQAVAEIDVVVRLEPGCGELVPVPDCRPRVVVERDLARGPHRHRRHPQERAGGEPRVQREDREDEPAERLAHASTPAARGSGTATSGRAPPRARSRTTRWRSSTGTRGRTWSTRRRACRGRSIPSRSTRAARPWW